MKLKEKSINKKIIINYIYNIFNKKIKNIELLGKSKIIKKYFKYFFIYYKNIINKNLKNMKINLDICGTGGDLKNTFNISSSVFLILSIIGVKCYKQGSKKITSKSGSVEFIDSLFKNYNKFNIKKKIKLLKIKNFLFLTSSDTFGKTNKKLLKLRKKINKPTVFNYVFSTINPINSYNQLIGINNKSLMKTVLKSVFYNKIKKAIILNSFDGMDELSIFSANKIIVLIKNKLINFIFFPKKKKYKYDNILICNKFKSVEIFLNSIKNLNRDSKDIIILNCSIILFLLNYVNKIGDGCKFLNKNFNNKNILLIFKNFYKSINDFIKNN
ncbi:hypothetical protein [Candidatus Vidania fulgoroideorum]